MKPKKFLGLKHPASQSVRPTFSKKSLGQNFLMHPRIAERIAHTAKIEKTDTVLEIGPGKGMLTRALLACANHVIAVEADGELVNILKETFAHEITTGRLELVHGDVRSYQPPPIIYKLVANIPYYITGEIFRHFLSASHKPQSITVLVQKEVAERVAREKKESILSVSIKIYGVPKYEFTVPRGAFIPAPNVDSAVLSVSDIKQTTFASQKEEEWFFTVLKTGFAHKRKLLAGNLSALVPPSVAQGGLLHANIALKARAEDVSPESWKILAHFLAN